MADKVQSVAKVQYSSFHWLQSNRSSDINTLRKAFLVFIDEKTTNKWKLSLTTMTLLGPHSHLQPWITAALDLLNTRKPMRPTQQLYTYDVGTGLNQFKIISNCSINESHKCIV